MSSFHPDGVHGWIDKGTHFNLAMADAVLYAHKNNVTVFTEFNDIPMEIKPTSDLGELLDQFDKKRREKK